MKTMSDLMLKAHFNELKDELNKSLKVKNTGESKIEEVLKQTYNYLKSKSQASKLDDRGQELYTQVAILLDEIHAEKLDLPGKLPMQKAGKKTAAKQRKTGS